MVNAKHAKYWKNLCQYIAKEIKMFIQTLVLSPKQNSYIGVNKIITKNIEDALLFACEKDIENFLNIYGEYLTIKNLNVLTIKPILIYIKVNKMIHTPYELRQIDLKELQAKIIYKDPFYQVRINNPKYQFKIKPYKGRSKEEAVIIMKYRLFKFLLEKNKIRYCANCNNLIFNKPVYIDICNNCMK
jgi:hypothetical protein